MEVARMMSTPIPSLHRATKLRSTLAYQYANGLDVEVWHRARRVGLIPREPKSIDLED
jgi:hypothetical protein